MKKQITKKEYLALEGLWILSQNIHKQQEDLVLAIAEITGEKLDEYNYGHASDFAYSPEETVKVHLRKLGIKIKKK